MNYIYGMTTLEALIELEIRALATICQVKSAIYKTWQPLAEKWKHFIMDDCTEHNATFVFDLPSLPEKVIDGEYDFDLDDEQPLSNGDSINLDYDDCLKDQPINGYQVAQRLIIFFYGFLHSILLLYCLDFLDRVIQIRSGIVDNHCDDEIPEYLVKWISPLTYAEDYL